MIETLKVVSRTPSTKKIQPRNRRVCVLTLICTIYTYSLHLGNSSKLREGAKNTLMGVMNQNWWCLGEVSRIIDFPTKFFFFFFFFGGGDKTFCKKMGGPKLFPKFCGGVDQLRKFWGAGDGSTFS